MNLRRKRMMLMDGQWYGYLRTATGNPLTLQAAKRLQKLTIYGNAVQDGTPSPDAPVEVQLCGDRTGNLLDASTIYIKNSNGNVDFDGKTIHVHSNSTGEIMWFWTNIYVQQGKTYAIQYSDSTISLRYAFSTEAITEYSSDIFANNTMIQNKFATFTATETGYLRIVFGLPVNTPDGTIDRLQVIEGTYTAETMPAYEPYGYKVSGRVEGMNLFNKDDVAIGYRIAGNGELYNSDAFAISSFASNYIDIKPNTIYSLNYLITETEAAAFERVCFYDADYRFVSKADVNVRTFTTPENAVYLRLCRLQTHLDDTMLVQGAYTAETMPAYEPHREPQTFNIYTPQQLAKVGDISDEVVVNFDNMTAELTKNVQKRILDGSEDWFGNYMLSSSTNRYINGSSFNDLYYQSRGISDRIPKVTVPVWLYNNTEGFTFSGTQLHISFLNTDLGVTSEDDDASRTQKFKAFLSTHPTTIYGPINKPATVDISAMQQWDAIPQVSGTVTLTLSAEVPPSGAEAIYYSKERSTE